MASEASVRQAVVSDSQVCHPRDETVSRRRDSYHVLEEGQERSNSKGYSDSDLALIAAQIRLEKGIDQGVAPDAQAEGLPRHTYYVTRQSLFGPSVTLYRVLRDETGAVLTYTIEKED